MTAWYSRSAPYNFFVMPGLVPGIHVFNGSNVKEDVDGRDKPGHDEFDVSEYFDVRRIIRARSPVGCPH